MVREERHIDTVWMRADIAALQIQSHKLFLSKKRVNLSLALCRKRVHVTVVEMCHS